MASTYTPSIGLELPARDDYKNTWDTPVNGNFTAIDGKLGGTTTVALRTATVTLTKAQAQAAALVFTGAISAPITVQIPTGMSGFYSVLNGTTGLQPVILQTVAAGAAIQIGPGVQTLVLSDGANVFLADQSGTPTGTPLFWLAPTIPSGFLLLYGQLLSRASYPGLFAVFGTTFGAGDGATTFGLPDMRGLVPAGLDNMGGTARGMLTSFGSSGQLLGAQGGEQSHVLAVAELAAHSHGLTDPGHLHAKTDPGHSHTDNVQGTIPQGTNASIAALYTSGAQGGTSPTGLTINTATTGISVNSNGSGTAHNNVQPTMLGNWIVKT